MNQKKKNYKSPLRCWDIYSEYLSSLIKSSKVDYDLKQLESLLKLELDVSIIDKIFKESYDALVITDIEQKIIWVNHGFSEMTGYSKSYARGKKPNFLQGPKTSNATKQSIRKSLQNKESFMGILLNYRKNGEEYLCQIKMIPLFNKESKHTHFLAVEKEVRAA